MRSAKAITCILCVLTAPAIFLQPAHAQEWQPVGQLPVAAYMQFDSQADAEHFISQDEKMAEFANELNTAVTGFTFTGGMMAAYDSYRYYEQAFPIPTYSTQYFASYAPYQQVYEIPGLGLYDGNQTLGLTQVATYDSNGNPSGSVYGFEYGPDWSFAPFSNVYGAWALGSADITLIDGTHKTVNCAAQYYYGVVHEISQSNVTYHSPNTCSFSYENDVAVDPVLECWQHIGDGYCTKPTSFWSDDGQSSLNIVSGVPILRSSSGAVEVFNGNGGGGVGIGNNLGNRFPDPRHQPDFYASTGQLISVNGEVTNYTYGPTGLVTGSVLLAVTDTRGRGTYYQYSVIDGAPTLSGITKVGLGGTPQTWTLNWGPSVTWNPANDFPDICAYNGSTSCPLATWMPLSSITTPDGRSYQFSYGNWGNLTQVTTPDGLINQYTYGNSTTTTFCPPPGWPAGTCSAFAGELPKRRVTTITTYPNGLNSVPLVDTITPETTTTSSNASSCGNIQWIVNSFNDPASTVTKQGICAPSQFGPTNGIAGLIGKAIAEETWSGSRLLSGTYHGDVATGTPWSAYEHSANPNDVFDVLLDMRPTQTKHTKDGLSWWELFDYECMSGASGNHPAYSGTCGSYRTWGNVTSHKVALDSAGGPGAALVTTTNSYLHNGATYDPRNIVRLPSWTQVSDSSHTLAETTFSYDNFSPLQPSGEPGLDTTYTNQYRGNLTKTNRYTNISTGAYVTTQGYYFDNGSVYKTIDANNNTSLTTTGVDFGKCYASATPTPILVAQNGSGAGAAGTCTVSSGTVNACTVTAAGSGYTLPASVTFIEGTGSGAVATTAIKPTSVATVSVTSPGAYTNVPPVSFSGGGGAAATASMGVANLNGNCTLPSLYEPPPPYPTCAIGCSSPNNPVGCNSQGGSGATCVCGCRYLGPGTGSLSCGCWVTAAGSGYTGVPTLSINVGQSGWTCSSVSTGALEVLDVQVTSHGSGYTSAPAVIFGGSGYAQATSNLSPTGIASITITSGGSGYQSSPASHTELVSAVLNSLGQTTTTVSDCYTGSVLSVKDANNAIACNQYDGLNRLVETAAPGDELSSQTQCATTSTPGSCYVRDTANCAASGGTIGNNGAGPTTWTEYFPFNPGGGVGYGQARTVSHVRNGTTTGIEQVNFTDGSGRSIEQCSQVDPVFNASKAAVCSATVYDNMGRNYQQYVPFYVSSLPASVAATPAADPYTQTLYDGLGRPTSGQLVGSGLPAVLTAYSSSGSDWVTTVTDANQCQTQTKTDVLGHAVEHDAQSNFTRDGNGNVVCSSSPTWLATTMKYDVAGRLLNVTDAAPSANVTSFQYDGLGRKTQMSDPDMGTWSYQYDNNGNLTQQTDARGATTHLHYDALNRVTLKDLPYFTGASWVSGTPGEEDEANYYDTSTNLPSACYSCDDHCAATTDTCNANTLTCTHSGPTVCPSTCYGPTACTPGATQSCGYGGTQTCTASCTWGTCAGQGCAPGSTETCGNCGTQTCGSNYQWGTCTGQGCTPGSTQSCGCGGTQTCTSGCGWGSCSGGPGSVTCYRDVDGDGYGNPAVSMSACGSCPSGYVTNNTDCYDNNASAHPGQTAYFTVNRGDGSFDYDCNGTAEQEWTGVGCTTTSNGSCPSCSSSTNVWIGSVPSCGNLGGWVTSCSQTPVNCGPSGQGTQCSATVNNQTQACR